MTVSFLAPTPKTMSKNVNSKIIMELKKARFSIWLANLWFTDKAIYDILIEKVKEGVNVEVLLDTNAPLNHTEQSKIQKLTNTGGEFFLTNETKQHQVLNRGFCMIDFSTIIDNDFDCKPPISEGFNTYFMKEYPKTLVNHYVNEYFSVKNNYCISRYS